MGDRVSHPQYASIGVQVDRRIPGRSNVAEIDACAGISGQASRSLIAQSVSAIAIADAMELFLQDDQLRARLLKGAAQAQAEFSMARFFQSITARERRLQAFRRRIATAWTH
jgi:hypothetical protein